MSQLITLKCDICGAIKQSANNWWKLLQTNQRYIVAISHEISNLNMPGELSDICSEGCLNKKEGEIREELYAATKNLVDSSEPTTLTVINSITYAEYDLQNS